MAIPCLNIPQDVINHPRIKAGERSFGKILVPLEWDTKINLIIGKYCAMATYVTFFYRNWWA